MYMLSRWIQGICQCTCCLGGQGICHCTCCLGQLNGVELSGLKTGRLEQFKATAQVRREKRKRGAGEEQGRSRDKNDEGEIGRESLGEGTFLSGQHQRRNEVYSITDKYAYIHR